MALTGLHVVCAPVVNVNSAPILGGPAWSETLATAGTTSRSCPSSSGNLFSFQLRAAADCYVARGANPNASGTTGDGDASRIFLPAGETMNIACFPGDKLAWIAA